MAESLEFAEEAPPPVVENTPPPEEEEQEEEPPPEFEEESMELDMLMADLPDLPSGAGSFMIGGGLDDFGVSQSELSDLFDSDQLDEAPQPISQVPPQYPRKLQRAGVSGQVMVFFIVDESGNVLRPKCEASTNRGFNSAALAAVKKWKFKPGLKSGRRVKAKCLVPINFNLT